MLVNYKKPSIDIIRKHASEDPGSVYGIYLKHHGGSYIESLYRLSILSRTVTSSVTFISESTRYFFLRDFCGREYAIVN